MTTEIPEKLNYCRKCMRSLKSNKFYKNVDNKIVDSNGLMAGVCKSCINKLYAQFYSETKSIEKSLHKLAVVLNFQYSNAAMVATREHINTLIDNGKKPRAIFGIYKSKLVSVNKSMDKSIEVYQGYADIATIYVAKEINFEKPPIPTEVISFWGITSGSGNNNMTNGDYDDIRFLEHEYMKFKETHKAEVYSEITLLKQVCYTLLDIQHARKLTGNTKDLVKELQTLMTNLAISPKQANTREEGKADQAFGTWIQDIETKTPAQWLLTDPRGDIYRDVADIESYYENYFVRPIKNFMTGSKDFNIEELEELDRAHNREQEEKTGEGYEELSESVDNAVKKQKLESE